MRVIRSALVIGLAAGLLPSPAIAQSSRGSFTPTCDAGLQVGNITSSQVSANCRQQDLASHVLNECINSFVADVDAVGQKGEQLAATVRELQSLQGQERIRKTVQAANREAGLVTKALKLIKEIRKGSGVLQDYAGDCMSNGLLDSLGLNREVSTLLEAKKDVDKANKVAKALQGKIERGDYGLDAKDNNTLGFLRLAYGTGQAFQGLAQKTVKVIDSWQSDEARSGNAMIVAKNAAGQCNLKQEDGQISLAGQTAMAALAQARYKRAEAWSIRTCWSEHAEEQLHGRSDTLSLEQCDACRELQKAQDQVDIAERNEKRLETNLAAVNTACRQLQQRAKAIDDLENRYLSRKEDSEYALRRGSCNLTEARSAERDLRKMEQQMDNPNCFETNGRADSAYLSAEILKRSRDADCGAAAAPAPRPKQGPAMPPPAPGAHSKPWSGTATGTCHVDYEGYFDGRNNVPPAPSTDFKHYMTFAWNADHKVYIIKTGSQTIVGSSLNFSFDDKCDQNQFTYQPGCIYKSRSNFTVRGTIAASGDTITYNTKGVEDINLATKKATGHCVLHKDKP
jgi:hypothetical protein